MTDAQLAELRQKLGEEVDTLPWAEILKHNPKVVQNAVLISDALDFLDTAMALARDDSSFVENAIKKAQITRPHLAELSEWHENPPVFRVLVVQPFVLLQKI
jgi:hypothetical protein